MSGLGRHWKANKDLISQTYDRDYDDTLKPSDGGYLDLRKSKRLFKYKGNKSKRKMNRIKSSIPQTKVHIVLSYKFQESYQSYSHYDLCVDLINL